MALFSNSLPFFPGVKNQEPRVVPTDETGAEVEARKLCEKQARAKREEIRELDAEIKLYDTRVRELEGLWAQAVIDHENRVQPLKAEIEALDATSIERIKNGEPNDPRAGERRIEIQKEIDALDAVLESHRPKPPDVTKWLDDRGQVLSTHTEPVAEVDKVRARAAGLRGQKVRLESEARTLEREATPPMELARVAVKGRILSYLDDLRKDAERFLRGRSPMDPRHWEPAAIMAERRRAREAKALLMMIAEIETAIGFDRVAEERANGFNRATGGEAAIDPMTC